MRKWIAMTLALVISVAGFLAGWLRLPALLGIGPGYSAEITCACVFVSGRTPESCANDLDPLARNLVSVTVSRGSRSVTACSLGLVRRTARYRDGYGCAIDD